MDAPSSTVLTFRVLKGPFYKRLRMVLPATLLMTGLYLLTALIPGPPDQSTIQLSLALGAIILVSPLLIVALPIAYEIEGGGVYGRYRFGRRRLRLPLDGSPLIVDGSVCGSAGISVCNDRRIFRFHEVDDQAGLRQAVKALLPADELRIVSRRATYTGVTIVNLLAGATLLALSLGILVLFAFLGMLSGRFELLFIVVPVAPILLLALLFLALGMNVRVHRDGIFLAATNMFRSKTHTEDVSDAWSTKHDSMYKRSYIETSRSSFPLPISFGTDRRLIYDVFAIAAGNYSFVEDQPAVAEPVEG